MKKTWILGLAISALVIASCSNSGDADVAATADSTAVVADTTVFDSTAVATDTLAADSAK